MDSFDESDGVNEDTWIDPILVKKHELADAEIIVSMNTRFEYDLVVTFDSEHLQRHKSIID